MQKKNRGKAKPEGKGQAGIGKAIDEQRKRQKEKIKEEDDLWGQAEGEVLREAREQAGFTQRELAVHLLRKQRAISWVEAGAARLTMRQWDEWSAACSTTVPMLHRRVRQLVKILKRRMKNR